ncbi:hypothetical protein V8C86DRAFT_3085516 [Haematococcus lacustris]
MGRFARQAWALTKKGLLLRARSLDVNFALLAQSVVVVFLIWTVNRAVNFSSTQFSGARAQTDPPAQRIGGIPDCRGNIFLRQDQACLSVLYSPAGDPVVEEVMAAVAARNQPPLPPSLIKAVANASMADQYLWDNRQTVMAAIHFSWVDNKTLAYTLQTNDSAAFFKGKFQDPNMLIQLPLLVGVEKEFARLSLQAPDLPFNVAIRDFPHPSLSVSSAVGRIAPVFLLASLMFNVVLLMQSVVSERESGVRGAMTGMGLMDSAYWVSVVVPELIMCLAHAALLTLLCMAFQFDLALRNAPALLFLLLLCSSLALTGGALLLAALVRK